jgi:hypothetical protein
LNVSGPFAGEGDAAHADYLAWTEKPTEQPGAVNLGAVMVWLRENLPVDAILCNGAGNYAAWIHRFFRFRRFAQHIAPTSGSMGYGVPAAVAMKRLFPERPVVCIAGDGDFLMNGQEFATAVQYGCRSSLSSPTTASTAPSACTRSVNIRAASSQPICAIPISRPTRGLSAVSASRSNARKISRGVQGGAAFGLTGDYPLGHRSRSHNAGNDIVQNPRQVARRPRRLVIACALHSTKLRL